MVIVDPEAVDLVKSLGVDDSKKITDAKISGLATEIRKICYGKYKVLSAIADKFVAAASILARDAFLRWHQDAKKQFGVTFPKGANSQVCTGRSYLRASQRKSSTS